MESKVSAYLDRVEKAELGAIADHCGASRAQINEILENMIRRGSVYTQMNEGCDGCGSHNCGDRDGMLYIKKDTVTRV